MTLNDLAPLLPEIVLFGMICVVLVVDLFVSDQRRGFTHMLAMMALALTAVVTLRHEYPAGVMRIDVFGGLFVRDGMGDVLKLFIYIVTAGAFVYAKSYLRERGLFKGEFYTLCLFAVLGMMVLISAGNLVTVYLGLELMALSSYALVALDRDNPRATEAAMKYFVLGALASGMLLYGMSMIYGATGSLDLAQISAAVSRTDAMDTVLVFGLVFLVVGLAFKLGAVPFHMWLPDVYHGAPTAVTLFIGSAPKLAAFAMAIRLLDDGLGPMVEHWQGMLAILAVLSLVIGNVVAIAQTNLKRMLAYSTISHVGFLLLGLVGGTADAYAAAMFYAICYSLMSAGAFGMIVLMARKGFEAEEIDDFKGLNQRHPWLAFMMLLVIGSLAGFPPLLGFYAKLMVLKSAVDAGMIWLAIVGVVCALIGAFYYLRVVKVMYFDEPVQQHAPQTAGDIRLVVTAAGLVQLLLGLSWGPLIELCLAVMRA